MELLNLSLFAVFKSLEQNQIVPKHIMTSRIEQLPIPLLLKQHLKSQCVPWGLQPILTKFTFQFSRSIDVPRQVEFHVYGFYGICGLFYDKKTQLLLEVQQNDCEEISVWTCTTGGHSCMKGDLRQKACTILKNLGVPVSMADFKSQCHGKILMQFNREIVLMEWKGDENRNCLDDILHWRNNKARMHHARGIPARVELKFHNSLREGDINLLSVFPSGSESELPPVQVSRELSLLDGMTCIDVERLKRILQLSDGHILMKLFDEASECDKM